MRVIYHPKFPEDIRRLEAEYGQISENLAIRFRTEVDKALEAIKASPPAPDIFWTSIPE